MAINTQRLTEIREGKRGVALGLYIDVADEDWEDYCLTVPTVMALDEEAGKRVLDAIRAALFIGDAQEVADDASEAVSIVLASALKDQRIIALMLDNVGGRPDGSIPTELAHMS